MSVLPFLLVACVVLAWSGPVVLTGARWTDREPVLGLLLWQALVGAVLLSCALSLALSLAAAWPAAHAILFTGAPRSVAAAYGIVWARQWVAAGAVLLAFGGVRTLLALNSEFRGQRAWRRRRASELTERAPRLPRALETDGAPGGGRRGRGPRERERLVVLENSAAEAWSLPGPAAHLVVTTGALRRLSDRELAAVLAHERGHVRARHHWLLQSAQALASAFPGARIFTDFLDETGRLVELAADDAASRRHGRLATALALVELNEARGVFGGCYPRHLSELPHRVDRLLAGERRLSLARRLRLTAAAVAAPAVPIVLALAPGLRALLFRG
ncbi:M56 family metallopeptidase [Phaeacidiphilus oryzae]|uniref:M56 family metallopeptidase n=1 Tax=Phaeacidiphilus oryzae TaxID=348818 RepID=UPI00055CCC9B|nr:M56 family metallopeptidase [Phaeacidiphilus oryzae]